MLALVEKTKAAATDAKISLILIWYIAHSTNNLIGLGS